ncbi:MAG TPA: hypothetical protein VGG46_15840 [Terriglobales bacterium]
MRRLLAICALALAAIAAQAQEKEQPPNSSSSDGMQNLTMPASQTGDSHESMTSADVNAVHAMNNMQGHMDSGPHMKMTPLRLATPGDEDRAQLVIAAARKVAEQYQDYRKALADGYVIFLPNVPQRMYHFTNYRYAMEAIFDFNPQHPTSLLYEKQGVDRYKIIGVMYTAPKHASLSELDSRVPLSIAQWHAHINLCLPPRGENQQMSRPGSKFGLAGSITSRDKCEAAGGRFVPQIFGWMVHVYPFEKTEQDIWSVERQMVAPSETQDEDHKAAQSQGQNQDQEKDPDGNQQKDPGSDQNQN